MRSMTGYGGCKLEQDGRMLHLEIKSVNHRYLDISFRIPRSLFYLEDDLRAAINARFSRGHVDVFMYYSNTREDARWVEVNYALLEQYHGAAIQMSESYGVPNDFAISHALRLPDVFIVNEGPEDVDAVKALALRALGEAAERLDAMRSAEGERLKADMLLKVAGIEDIAARIQERSPVVMREYREKLEARLRDMLDGKIDEQRMAVEAAIFADKSAIDEEIVRLASHFKQMRAALHSEEPSGRRMDFIVQEMNREINTIGSKASDAAIGALVVSAKSEIEKIREQVQNVE